MAWNTPGQIGGTVIGGNAQMGQNPMGSRQLPYQPSQPPMGQPQGGAQGGNVPRGIPQGEMNSSQRFGGAGGMQPSMGMPNQNPMQQMPQMPNRGPMGMNPQMWQRLMQMIQQRQGGRGGWNNKGPDVIGGPPATGNYDPNNPQPSPYMPRGPMGYPGMPNPNIGNGTGSNSRTSTDWLKRHPEEQGLPGRGPMQGGGIQIPGRQY